MSELITGAEGQLGKALRSVYPDGQFLDRSQLDISDYESLMSFDWGNVQTIINAAAYTQVDQAETSEGMVAAWRANSQGVANLAAIARQHELSLVHISTDYVFDGNKKEPYTETDPINPQGVYARSKAAGDLAATAVPKHYLVRTSWLIGDGNNFVRTMLRLGAAKEELTIVNDQIGRPTFATDLTQAIHHLENSNSEYGLYNFSNDGKPASWADFARAIFELANIKCTVKDTSTVEYSKDKQPWAPRPANSVLNLDKIKSTGLRIPNWQDSLKIYIEEEVTK